MVRRLVGVNFQVAEVGSACVVVFIEHRRPAGSIFLEMRRVARFWQPSGLNPGLELPASAASGQAIAV